MLEIIGFFLAGGALGGASTWLHNREPSTLVLLGGLYVIALAVCFAISHASKLEMAALIAPYVLVAIAASFWSAGMTVRWPSSARLWPWNAGRGRSDLAA